MRVANLSPLPREALTLSLEELTDLEVVAPEPRDQAGVLAAVARADVILGDYAFELAVDRVVVAAMERVRLFHQPTTGYDRVDAEALAAAGIPLTNAGPATSLAMAEYVVMTTLALLRSLAWCDREVRAGRWPQHDVVQRSLVELAGRTVGLVGFGNAAQLAARRLAAFDCRVLYTARTRRPPEVEAGLDVQWAELDELLAGSDVVVLLAELNAGTRGLLDAGRIARMKRGAFLVNAARGELVDEAALAAALADGRLGGAALDVAVAEPPPAGWALRDLDNVLLTPHVAGATLDARVRMLQRTVAVIRTVAAGRLPDGVVNGVTALRAV